MKKPHQSIRMFKSDWAEKNSHVHPATPAVIYIPLITWMFWRSGQELSLAAILPLALAGFFVWTLAEYLLHRFVFHFDARTPLQKRIYFIIHGVHHDDPEDATRLVMPPIAGFIIAGVLFSLFRVLLGPAYVIPFFAAFLIGYLCYDYIHFYVHHFTPTTRVGKFIKQSHMIHHYVAPDSRWGVSSPLWDYVFGTYERRTSARGKPQEQHTA